MGQTDLLQPTEPANQRTEVVPSVTSAPLNIPHEILPQQASRESNVRRIVGASAPTISSVYLDTTTDCLPSSNAEVMQTRSIEYTTEQSVFTHPALAMKLINRMVLPHDRDSVAQKDTLVDLMCQAMKDATWKMGVSQKLVMMQHGINVLKEERNALRVELESQKMAVTQRFENEVEGLEIRLKETEERAWAWEDQFTKLQRRLKQAEDRVASAERKVIIEMAKSRVAEETLKNFKASQEFQCEVDNYHTEAYNIGLNVVIKKINRQFPDLDLSMIDFYSED